jgi:hypothetical protein
MSICIISTLRHIPEDGILHSHHHENLKSYMDILAPKIEPFRCATKNKIAVFLKLLKQLDYILSIRENI